jgi:hypothetical protein
VSQPVPVFLGWAKRGRVEWDAPTEASGWVRSLEGERIEVRIQKWQQTRSLRANAYLWVVYGYIAKDQEMSAEDVHEFMKAKFLGTKTLAIGHEGALEEQTVVGSTAVLKVQEFCDYVAKVKQFAAEWLGLIVPEPEAGLLEKRRRAA